MENIRTLMARLKADLTVRKITNDGGPGSGNFGHSGRPGKVGGSGPGGGKQYRGGRADIGYFSSRKDWLNGLTGERQQEATTKLNNAKNNLQHFLSFKDRLIQEWESGMIGITELQNKLEKNELNKVYKGMPTEEFVMKMGNLNSRKELLDLIGEARSWKELAMRQQRANLSNEEQKYLGMICMDYQEKHPENEDGLTQEELANYNLDRVFDKLTPEQQEFYLDMKAKACGIENSGKPIEDYSDDFLISVGAKEAKSKNPEEWFNWMDSKKLAVPIYNNSRSNLLYAAGMKLTQGDLIANGKDRLNAWKKTLNDAKYDKSFSQERAEAAARVMRYATMPEQETWNQTVRDAMDGKNIPGLDEQETQRFLDILKSSKPPFSDIKDDDVERLEMSVVDNADRNELIDYATLKSKAISGIEPDTPEVHEEKINKEKQEKKAKTKAFIDGLDEWGKKVSEAKSSSEIGTMLTESGMFKKDAVVKLLRTSKTAAIGIAKSYGQVIKKFPFLYGELGDLDENEHGKDTYACCHMHTGLGISVNASPMYFGDAWNLDGQYEENVRKGFHPKGTHSDSIVTHEIGHALDGWLSKRKVIGSSNSSYDTHCFSGELRRRVLRKLKMTQKVVGDELSEYAMKNAWEWFAEAFAEGMHSPEPRPMAKETMRQLNEILVEEGLLDG